MDNDFGNERKRVQASRVDRTYFPIWFGIQMEVFLYIASWANRSLEQMNLKMLSSEHRIPDPSIKRTQAANNIASRQNPYTASLQRPSLEFHFAGVTLALRKLVRAKLISAETWTLNSQLFTRGFQKLLTFYGV